MSARPGIWKKRLAVAFLSPIVLLFLLELVLRLFFAQPEVPTLRFQFANAMDAEVGLEGLFRENERTFWDLRPGARHPEAGDTISSLGLRGPERDPTSPADPFRIAVLGDSCTFGIRLADEKTYGRRLEELLAGREPTVEVWNGGVPGFTLYQGRVLFEDRIRALEPDLVVLYFGAWNDFNAAFGASDRVRGQGGVEPGAREKLSALLLRLRSIQLVAARYGKTLRYRHWRASVNEWLAGEPRHGYRVPLEDFRELLEELCAACEELGADVVVILPELNRDEGADEPIHFERLERYRDLLAEVAQRRALSTLDLRALFEPGAPADLFRDLVHPSARGHLWIAQALGDLVRGQTGMSSTVKGTEPVELALRATPGSSEVSLLLDAGAQASGRSYRILASLTPAPFTCPPQRPLEEDAASAYFARTVPELEGQLDAAGRAEVRLSVPRDLEVLRSTRALGFSAEVGDAQAARWTNEVFLPL